MARGGNRVSKYDPQSIVIKSNVSRAKGEEAVEAVEVEAVGEGAGMAGTIE